jgi:hypothetical protein
VEIIEARLAEAGRRNVPITYSAVADGIDFQLSDGRNHAINIHEWTGLDRQIIGDFLGFIAARTFANHGFMASALAVDATDMQPSDSFFRVAVALGALSRDTKHERDSFWIRHFNLAHEFYRQQEEMPTAGDLFTYAQTVLEGAPTKLTAASRSRCDSVRRLAKEEYRGDDGLLRCEACGWARPFSLVEADIVEMHHRNPLATAPAKGRRLTMEEAIHSLMPLCPNCHRIMHAKPGGGIFTLLELQDILTSLGRSP